MEKHEKSRLATGETAGTSQNHAAQTTVDPKSNDNTPVACITRKVLDHQRTFHGTHTPKAEPETKANTLGPGVCVQSVLIATN